MVIEIGSYFPLTEMERRFRPLARRLDKTSRPSFVDIRALKPCTFFRRRLWGWYVRFMISASKGE